MSYVIDRVQNYTRKHKTKIQQAMESDIVDIPLTPEDFEKAEQVPDNLDKNLDKMDKLYGSKHFEVIDKNVSIWKWNNPNLYLPG